MIKKNNKISSFQLLILGSFISKVLFIGIGNIILVITVKQNTWIIGLICIALGILPILLINKIFDYEPKLNLFDKIKKIFNKKIGIIINLIISLFILLVLVINTWSIANFASTKYLTETPFIFLAFMFILPVTYACIKGIETISRTSEILFYFISVIYFIIVFSLFEFINIENLKPIMNIDTGTFISGILKFIALSTSPFIALTIIPKENITDVKNSKKALIFGYVIGACLLTIVFFMTMSILGINVISLYRYPEYYVIKKVEIGNAIDNVENFLSIHWMFDLLVANMLNTYFLSEFIFNSFNVINKNIRKIIIYILSLLILFLVINIFETSTASNEFVNNYFLLYIALPLLLIITTIILFIKFKKKNIKT